MQLRSVDSTQAPQPEKLLRLRAVVDRTGLSRTTIYAMERKGEFPKKITLNRRTTCWASSDIDRWIAQQIHGGQKT